MTTAPQPLDKLERTIAARAANPNEKSYTSQLLAGGVAKIGAKIIEEAAEVVEAAGEPGDAGREHFIREVGDLVYHLLVLMRHQELHAGRPGGRTCPPLRRLWFGRKSVAEEVAYVS